jgi:hypothetical protein
MDIVSLPNCPAPEAKKERAACSQHGKKWESSGNTGQNRGSGTLFPA